MYASATIKEIMQGLETVFIHCETIQDGHACDKCPLFGICLEDTPLTDVANEVSTGMWEEFVAFADDVESYVSDEDMRAYFDDMASKAERDEYYD